MCALYIARLGLRLGTACKLESIYLRFWKENASEQIRYVYVPPA